MLIRFAAGARRLAPAALVLVIAVVLYGLARLPSPSDATRASLASSFRFTQLPIELPPGLASQRIRQVNPAYESIRSWISSVGSGVAINDLEGSGLANDLCLVDPRSNSVIVTPTPGEGRRFAPFVLQPAPLPMNNAMAPMGCVPGDFNGDGRMDLLVYYWGRTPILFMGQPHTAPLSSAAYLPTELVSQPPAADGQYHGQLWNTNAVAVADFDGDGHPDLGVFNYFPDSQVLDPNGQPNVHMNLSLSKAQNGGGVHILRWVSATGGATPSAGYQEQPGAIDPAVATGWTLAAGTADLDGDLLPELYVANDFGNDHLFHDVSTPGHIRFQLVRGQRGPTTPKSMVLGNDSFKGMSVDFGDLRNNGRFDIFVSNITTSWGLEESNFVWMNNAGPAAAKAKLDAGVAPFSNAASALNMAWTGWGWDAKMADLDNSGNLSVVQTDGFLDGSINRWAWLQELAMSNDELLSDPAMWPKMGPGDDVAGNQHLAFWVREDTGRYVDISHHLGLDVPVPTRAVAVADTTGDGAQDFAVARQWGPPAFYHNDHPTNNGFLGLRLYRPAVDTTPGAAIGAPAYGAVVQITTADGHTQIAQLDGGSGHSGKRSFDVLFGLGTTTAQPVRVQLRWRDLTGQIHAESLHLMAGWHDFVLDSHAQEVALR